MSVFKSISNLLLSLFSDGQIDADDCCVDGDTLAAIGVDEDRIDEICLSSSNESADMGGGGVSADCRFGVEDRIESRFRELEAWKGGLNESIDRAMGSDMDADTIRRLQNNLNANGLLMEEEAHRQSLHGEIADNATREASGKTFNQFEAEKAGYHHIVSDDSIRFPVDRSNYFEKDGKLYRMDGYGNMFEVR